MLIHYFMSLSPALFALYRHGLERHCEDGASLAIEYGKKEQQMSAGAQKHRQRLLVCWLQMAFLILARSLAIWKARFTLFLRLRNCWNCFAGNTHAT